MSAKDQLFKNVMQSREETRKKVTIIGSGNVGMATAFSILERQISRNVVIISRNSEKVRGEIVDLQHGVFFLKDARITGGTELSLSAGSQLIIFTAGARQKEGESRFDLLQKNVDILRSLIPRLVHLSPDAILLIVSTPCDTLAYVTWKLSGLPKNRVIGTGTHLDSSRFRSLLAQKFGAPVPDTDGWIIGEHGKSCIPVWSGINIAGIKLHEVLPTIGQSNDSENLSKLHEEVVNTASEVNRLKGYSSWGIGLSCADIARVILGTSSEVKTVSTMVKGLYGINKEAFLSLPCVLSRDGISSIVNIKLSESERSKIHSSANLMDEIQKGVSF